MWHVCTFVLTIILRVKQSSSQSSLWYAYHSSRWESNGKQGKLHASCGSLQQCHEFDLPIGNNSVATVIDARNNAPKHTQEACKRSKYSPQVASRRVVSARVARTTFSSHKHETSIRFGHAWNTAGIVATDSVSRWDR